MTKKYVSLVSRIGPSLLEQLIRSGLGGKWVYVPYRMPSGAQERVRELMADGLDVQQVLRRSPVGKSRTYELIGKIRKGRQ